MAIREDTDPNSPTYGQYIDDGGGQTPNISDVTYGPDYNQTHQLDAGGNPLPGTNADQQDALREWGRDHGWIGADHTITPENWDQMYALWVRTLGRPATAADQAAFTREYGARGAKGGGFGNPTTPGGETNGDADGFGRAWLAYARGLGHTPRSTDLAAFIAAHPGYGASVTGSKGGTVRIGGKNYDALYKTDAPDSYANWYEAGGGSDNSGGQGGDFALNPDYLAPFTTPFEPGADTQLPTPPGGTPFSYPDFNVPDPSQIALDPSYQFRLNQGIDAIKSNKAAMGTLNTGGTIKDYLNYGQGAASQEYSNIFDRNFRTWGANRDNAFGSWAANTTQANTGFGQQKGLADTAYTRAWQRYQGLEDTFRANQSGPASKLLSLANIGSNAASI